MINYEPTKVDFDKCKQGCYIVTQDELIDGLRKAYENGTKKVTK